MGFVLLFLMNLILPDLYASAGLIDIYQTEHQYYQCSEPIPLKDSFKHLKNKDLENSVEWNAMAAELKPSPWHLNVVIANELGSGEVRATLSSKAMSIDLEAMTSGPKELRLFKHEMEIHRHPELKTDPIEEGILEANEFFQIFALDRDINWHELMSDAYIFTNGEYGIWFSQSLKSVSVCLSHEKDKPRENLDGTKVRADLFQFLAQANSLKLFSCEKFLIR